MKKKSFVLLYELIFCIVLIIFDQLSKRFAVIALKDQEPIPIIKHVLELYYLPNGNTGAAFGLFSGQQWLFLIIGFLVVAAIIYALIVLPYERRFKFLRILLVFIMAGGIGNMIDRFLYRYVIDFIYISIINFPIFNVADIYVSVSTVLLAILFLFVYKEEDAILLEKLLFRKK